MKDDERGLRMHLDVAEALTRYGRLNATMQEAIAKAADGFVAVAVLAEILKVLRNMDALLNVALQGHLQSAYDKSFQAVEQVRCAVESSMVLMENRHGSCPAPLRRAVVAREVKRRLWLTCGAARFQAIPVKDSRRAAVVDWGPDVGLAKIRPPRRDSKMRAEWDAWTGKDSHKEDEA